MVLARDPLCVMCVSEAKGQLAGVEPATEADHIVPLRRGGTNELSNLQGLCHRHHSRKTATEDSNFVRSHSTR